MRFMSTLDSIATSSNECNHVGAHTVDEIHVTRDNAFVIARLVILVVVRRYTGTMATILEVEDVAGCRLGNEVVDGLADIGARRCQ